MDMRKICALSLSAVLALGLFGCGRDQALEPLPSTKEDKPILSIPETTPTEPTEPSALYTPVYASVFEGTLYLSPTAIPDKGGEAPECDIREVSLGGQLRCGGEHEKEVPVTHVVILEDIYPKSTAGWFQGMADLESIQGLEKLHIDSVTDMSRMFSGCVRLSALDGDHWDVSLVEDMSGIFDGCDSLAKKPVWYEVDEGQDDPVEDEDDEVLDDPVEDEDDEVLDDPVEDEDDEGLGDLVEDEDEFQGGPIF